MITLKKRFLDQLECGDAPIFEGEDLQDLIEQGAVESLQNFGVPSHIIKMEDNLYIVGQVNSDSVKLKTMSETEGAIVVYTPKWFSVLKLKENTDVSK